MPRTQRAPARPVAALAAALSLAVAAGCSVRTPGEGRGVLLIAVDELRADHTSALGYDRQTTPHLDRLAEDGAVFARTYSTAPLLIPAHATLLSGCYPAISRRWISDRVQLPEAHRWVLADKVPRLAVEFLSAGYATAAFLDTESLIPFGRFDDGFQVFDRDDSQDRRTRAERGGAALSTSLRAWLSELAPDENWFAYLHLRDLERAWLEPDPQWDSYFVPRRRSSHVPPVGLDDVSFFAIPSSRWDGLPRTLAMHEARYDGALRRVDETLGALFRSLELQGFSKNTTICVVGTYGLQFGEAGLVLSSGLLSVPDLHVPWILRPAPGSAASGSGRRFGHLASLVDVAPTLLELEGLEVPSGMHGVSHVPVLVGETDGVREHAFASSARVSGAAVFGERWALEELEFEGQDPERIREWFGTPEPSAELTQRRFYLHRLPAEARELTDEEPSEETAARLSKALSDWQLNMLGAWAILQKSNLFDAAQEREVAERLRELGYLGESP